MVLTRLCSIFIFSSMLFGCTEYGPTGDYGGFRHGGYSDMRINENTVSVNFDGGLFASPRAVQDFVLYRAAKVTIDNGYRFFVIESSSLSPIDVNVSTTETYNGYMTDPPRLFTAYPNVVKFDSYSTSMSSSYQQGNPCRLPSGASIIIKMFANKVPRGVPRSYNAYWVTAHIGPETF